MIYPQNSDSKVSSRLRNITISLLFLIVGKAFGQTSISGNTITSGTVLPQSSGNSLGSFNIYQASTGPSLTFGIVNTGNSTTHWGWLQTAYTNNAGVYGILALNPLGGNVGIGTSSPNTKLHVMGGITSIVANATGDNNNLLISNPNAASTTSDLRGDIWLDNDGRMKFRTTTSYGMAFRNTANTTDIMNITDNGIGIGTNTPSGYLSFGTYINHKKILLNDNGNNLFGFGLGNDQFESYINNAAADNHFSWGNLSTDGNFTFSELMRLSTSGSLSIGTTDPKGYMLAVNGSAIATSITVKTNASWPDYVFKPQYKLQPLSDVKAYIDENHHLPEMPSEAEIAMNGQNLGEINKLLVKKVEELTLYLMAQDEKINAQDRINKHLIEEFKSLENKLNKLNDR